MTCIKGLEEVVAGELRADTIGAREVHRGSSGVWFAGDAAAGYRANLWLRCGIRVLAEIARGAARDSDGLYAWAREIPWENFLSLERTFAVDARVHDSGITHSKFAALRVKDALCDRFRDTTGRRPDVNTEHPDLPLFLYLHRDQAALYRDLSGATLHKRGYRAAMHRSNLNETVAAGMAILAGWDGTGTLCDPMCGSGTIIIEAALAALCRAPGLLRKRFPFESWPDFDARAWEAEKTRARAAARDTLPAPILANDIHPGSLALARRDARAAGVDRFIQFSQGDIAGYHPSSPPAVVLVNPPWGERLRETDTAGPWRALGEFLHNRCPGATAWVLSGNAAVTRHLGLKTSRRFPLDFGGTECRLLRYDIRPVPPPRRMISP
ncbi:MAG: THUMP domain-containing protein [Planctomycetota bacterium]